MVPQHINLILPEIRGALECARPEIRHAVRQRLGLVRWLMIWPLWSLVWMAIGASLPLIVRCTIEASRRRLGPLVPVLEVVRQFSEFIRRRYIPDLDDAFLDEMIALFRTEDSPAPLRFTPLGELINQ